MLYYVEPSSVFLKPSFILKPGLESSVIPPYKFWNGIPRFLSWKEFAIW